MAAVTWSSSSGDVTIHYILPVLWMTLCTHNGQGYAMRQRQSDSSLNSSRGVNSPEDSSGPGQSLMATIALLNDVNGLKDVCGLLLWGGPGAMESVHATGRSYLLRGS